MLAGFTVCGRRDGRVAEGDGLLNRYTAKSRIGGSNPPLSAISIFFNGGTSSVKMSLASSLATLSAPFFGELVWTTLAAFRPGFSLFCEAISEGSEEGEGVIL